MKPLNIGKRSLSKSEAEIISSEIALTPNIIGYLPYELTRLDDVLVIENQTEIIGMLAYIETKKFIDLKIIIVREKFRHEGYGSELFHAFFDLQVTTKKPIYTVTKDPAMIHLVKGAGFVPVRLFQLPVPCILHQSKMIFSRYRIKELIRKSIEFRGGAKFSYWIKNP
jgi:N-acetylglutamate synthase-like GNAT family acetyltransferase